MGDSVMEIRERITFLHGMGPDLELLSVCYVIFSPVHLYL